MYHHLNTNCKMLPSTSGAARGIVIRGQIYIGAPIGVVEIHLWRGVGALQRVPETRGINSLSRT